MKPNATSIDFPLFTRYGYKVPQKKLLIELPKTRLSCINEYNNETPDFFRLDSMVKCTQRYNNPFLNEVINVNRNESLKALEKSKSQIGFIDKLKGSRNLSQNPLILRKIQNETNKAIKGTGNYSSSSSLSSMSSPRAVNIAELPFTDEKFKEKIRALHYLYSPKISFKMKRKVDLKKNVEVTDHYYCSSYDKTRLEKLETAFDPKKSSYLRNLNDYDIKENMGVTDSSRFHFDRVEETVYNPIIDKLIVVKSPVITNPKWNRINETYVLLLDNLKRKGGLFSEFINKNKACLDLITEERKLKMLKAKKGSKK